MPKGSFWQRWLWTPILGLLLLFTPQREVFVRQVDGEDLQYRGFPLLWQLDSVNSGDFAAYAGPLIANLLLLATVAWPIAWLWRRATVSFHPIGRAAATIGIWVAGMFSLFLVAFAIYALGTFSAVWIDPINPDDVTRTRWRPF